MQCSYETSTHWKTVGSSKAIRFQVNGLPFIQTFRIIANAVLEASVVQKQKQRRQDFFNGVS